MIFPASTPRPLSEEAIGDRATCCAKILQLVAGGTNLRDACHAAGIYRDIFLHWRLEDAGLSRRYFEARASWVLVRLDDAMEELARAGTPVQAQRWRTIVQALQWETERLLVEYRKKGRSPGKWR